MAAGKYTDSDLASSTKMGKYSDDDLAADFTGGPSNTEGKYRMVGPDGKSIGVAYSQVNAAAQSGYTMHPSDRLTYVRDAASDPNLNQNETKTPGVKIVGRNSAGQPIYGSDTPPPSGFVGSTFDALKQGVKGAGQFLNPRETPEEKERNAKSGPLGYLYDNAIPGMYLLERMAEGQIGEAQKAKEEFTEANKATPWTTPGPKASDEALLHRKLATGHALAAALPGVGPWAAQAGEKIGEQIAGGNHSGAAGTFTGNAIIYMLPHLKAPAGALLSKSFESLPETFRTGVRTTLGVTDKQEDLIHKFGKESEEVTKKNAEAAQKFEKKSAEAKHATEGREVEHKYDVHQKAQEGATKYKQEAADVEEHNNRVRAKTIEKHKSDAAKVQADNQKVADKYIEERNRITEENKAAEHSLELRRNEEAQLQKDTDAYYAKEDAVAGKTKAGANAKWAPVHSGLDVQTIDGSVIQQPLSKIIEISPDVRREVRQLVPDPEDAEPTSPYVQKRNEILKGMGHKEPQAAYDAMDDFNRANVDRAVAAEGFTPDPIDLDPQSGVAIPFDKIHRAQSIIGRNIRNGRYGYEGPLLGEMKQLQRTLYNAESQIAATHGMTADLDAARQATREYQEAFGRARNTPKTQADLRKQQANPEQFKEDNEQERVEAAKKHDPSLAKDYEKVRARREALKKLQTEDQLRKSIQQVPPPPSVGDLRPGYALKPYPVYEPPTVGDLRPGYELKPHPELPRAGSAVAAVKEQERVPLPEETQPLAYPDGTEIPTETQRFIYRKLRQYGAVGPWVLRMLVGGTALHVLGGSVAAFGNTMLIGQTAVSILTDAMRRPSVVDWLSKPSAEQIKMIDALPPEDAARLRQALVVLASDELSRKVAAMPTGLDPTIARFLLGAGASQNPTLDDLKKKAQELQNQQAAPPPGPQSSLKITHRFDPVSGSIVAA